jgi:hypothetical protein
VRSLLGGLEKISRLMPDPMAETKEQRQNMVAPAASQVPASRESLFGTLLFTGMVFMVLVVLGVIGFWGYRSWQVNKEQADLPSIAALPMTEEKQVTPPVKEEPQETKEGPTPEEVIRKAKGTEIKVLNGGAAKGSAAVVGDVLKKDGYTKVTVGNTTGNYTGTVVYFTTGLEKEAGVVKELLFKNYPKTVAQEALSNNKETSQAPITVILGKE